MAKMIKLVADVEKPSPKPRVMEYRYQVFCISLDGVVTRVGSYETETQANDSFSLLKSEYYRIVDMNCILDAW